MILVWLLILPAVSGIVAWPAARIRADLARWVCLAGLSATLALALALWVDRFEGVDATAAPAFRTELDWAWIPQVGVRFHLGVDGLSLVLIILTALMGLIAVGASWTETQRNVGFFSFNLMWVLTGVIGVFLALDLFLFYFFWELMLAPMYFLIGLWGHERRMYAAVKFFLFTQVGGLLMLVAILGLYFIHGDATGDYTFDYAALLGTSLSGTTATLLLLGFGAAFAVKLPMVPLHTWLPDAHTEAPTAGSIILAALLLKTGAYGLLRFAVPFFPDAASDLAPAAMSLAVVGILYGALLSFGQRDFKRLVAYTSVSHMGFVLLGIFAGNELALQGVVLQIVTHALSTGGLFLIAGLLQERTHTRDTHRFGGLWATVPRMGGSTMALAMAALGLPGLGNFLAEFLILAGTFQEYEVFAVLASLGLILSTIYSLWLVQATFFGQNSLGWRLPDLSLREAVMVVPMLAGLFWLGLYPRPVINMTEQSLPSIERLAQDRAGVEATDTTPRSEALAKEMRH